MLYFVFLLIHVSATFTITKPADFSISIGSTKTLAWSFSFPSITDTYTCSITTYLGEIKFPNILTSSLTFPNSITYAAGTYYQRVSVNGIAANLNTAFTGTTYQPHKFYTTNGGTQAEIQKTDYIEIVCYDATNTLSTSASTMVGVGVGVGSGWVDDSTCGGYNCDGHGWCDKTTATCFCFSPYYQGTGTNRCDYIDCGYCANGGSCNTGTGKCTCSPNTKYFGDHCEIVSCPIISSKTCSNNGWCNPTNGICQCYAGYTGEACELIYCLNNCNGNGVCNTATGACTCATNFFGTDCAYQKCPRDCGAYGGCNYSTGKCKCYGTYSASDCYFASCPGTPACSSNGVCNYYTGECVCNSGYVGVDCSTVSA